MKNIYIVVISSWICLLCGIYIGWEGHKTKTNYEQKESSYNDFYKVVDTSNKPVILLEGSNMPFDTLVFTNQAYKNIKHYKIRIVLKGK